MVMSSGLDEELSLVQRMSRDSVDHRSIWNNKICHCCSFKTVAYGLLCPCIAQGDIHSKIRNDKDRILFTLVYCLANGSYLNICCCVYLRSEFRGYYSIEGDLLNDCLVSTFCPCCTVIQMLDEIKV
ncbi:hypothetical protein MHBO_001959, partial [Bonamia ostreae]